MSENDRQRVIEWFEGCYPLILDIYLPLAQHEFSLLSSYDDVFRDSIKKNFREMLSSLLSIEFSRGTGCSSEIFYSVADDEFMDKLIYRLEDYNLSEIK